MPVDLTGHLDRLVRRVETQVHTEAGAEMADTLQRGAQSAMGGDLTFSGGGGTVRIEGDADVGRAVVKVAGAYGLADKGRRRQVEAVAGRGSALRTPWGPRRSVRGSTWRGFGLTDRYGRDALRAGIDAVVDNVDWGR
jgi:hypothetical protein